MFLETLLKEYFQSKGNLNESIPLGWAREYSNVEVEAAEGQRQEEDGVVWGEVVCRWRITRMKNKNKGVEVGQ